MAKYQKDGCLCCETFPYLEATGMCAACTFGEAEAQVEMLSGQMEGTVWECDEKPRLSKRQERNKKRLDKAARTLNGLGYSYTTHNQGYQFNINTEDGLVCFWPTTRKVSFGGKVTKLSASNNGNTIAKFLSEIRG